MIHNLLPKLKITRNDSEHGRTYTTPEGNIYPSVTEWISRTSDNSHLVEWRNAVGNEEADRVSSRASRRGTDFHNLVESFLSTGNVDFGKNILLKNQFKLFGPVLDRVSDIRGLEYPLYSDILKLAGTCDCIASFDGVPAVIDWKTSNDLKSLSMIENYWLQLTIYSLMIEERYGLHLPQIVVAISVDSMKPQVFKGIRNDWFPLLAKRIKQHAN
jgi:hypothetical protein